MAQRELNAHPKKQLADFRDLLLRWNLRFNLTAIREPEDIDRKLIDDAISMLPAVDDAIVAWSRRRERGEAANARPRLIDVGSGAGFPGMVLKIAHPELKVTLLEATGKKVSFLTSAIEELGLEGIEAIHGRAEEIGRQGEYREQFDLATARAVASLPALVELCLPFLSDGGVGIFPKGMGLAQELEAGERAAAMVGGMIVSSDPVQSGDGAPMTRLVIAVKLERTPNRYPRRSGLPVKEPLGRANR
jgi:16S rRNA (guanine527-N7)-methyltransferase